jgi:hypothetical protein
VAVDWTPLAEDDPLPGDPLGVSQLAGLLAADALELRSVIEGLNKVDTCEIWSGRRPVQHRQGRRRARPADGGEAHG